MLNENNMAENKQEAKVIWQRLHQMSLHDRETDG